VTTLDGAKSRVIQECGRNNTTSNELVTIIRQSTTGL
jgi:hypothetical protein